MRSCNRSCGQGGPWFWVAIGLVILASNGGVSASSDIPILFLVIVGVCAVLLMRKKKGGASCNNNRRNIPVEGADQKEDFKEEDFV